MGTLPFLMGPGFEYRPNAVTNFTVSHNNALLTATLDWTNPIVNTMGNTLNELMGVKIYRDGDLIDEVTDVTMGAPYSYDDATVPSSGEYEYEVVPYNTYGDGIGFEVVAWIGLDRPGEAINAEVTPSSYQGLSCAINWESPTEGEHGAYWPAGSWTGQKVYRNGVMLIDLPGTNNSHVDDSIPAQGFYSYGISYYNSSGEGPVTPAFPNPVFAGVPEFEQIPYSWVEISALGTNTGLVGNNVTLGPFDMGFDFPFYEGTVFNSLLINDNGRMSFTDSPQFAYANYPIPYPDPPNNMIAPYWDDLMILTGAVYYFHDAVNGRFIVEYRNLLHETTGGNYTFEVIFYPNGDIDFMYQDITPGTVNSATVGIENATGTDGLQITYDGSGPIEPTSQMGIRIYSVAPAPQIEVAPDSLLFAPTFIGETATIPFTISNIGTTSLIINDMQNRLDDIFTFNWSPGDSLIRAGEELTVDITFAPSDTLYYTDELIIYNNDVQVSVYLEGRGDFQLGAESVDEDLPLEFGFMEAYPNPFNPETTLSFDLPVAGYITLSIYDIQGREIVDLYDGWHSSGSHSVIFNASGLSSGVYFAVLNAGGTLTSQKLLLLK